MPSEFLNRSRWSPMHRQVRTERVAENVDADVHQVRASSCARDQPLNFTLRQWRPAL